MKKRLKIPIIVFAVLIGIPLIGLPFVSIGQDNECFASDRGEYYISDSDLCKSIRIVTYPIVWIGFLLNQISFNLQTF